MDIKFNPNNIQVCPLGAGHCFEDWLIHLGLSKSWIKKKMSKKDLKKKIHGEVSLSCDLINKNMINPYYNGKKITILYEDHLFLVLDKPSGTHGHPLNYSDQNNVLSFLRSVNKGNYLLINQKKAERGLLYRLDYETSGVLVYVKDEILFNKLFNDRKTLINQKSYLALVEGKTKGPLPLSLTHYLTGSEKKGSQMIIDENGQYAKLHYQTVSYDDQRKISLIEVSLETGLRHQIRAQLAASGHPLIGDIKYGGRASDRIYLHAKKYSLDLKSINTIKKEIVFEAPLPLEFLSAMGQ